MKTNESASSDRATITRRALMSRTGSLIAAGALAGMAPTLSSCSSSSGSSASSSGPLTFWNFYGPSSGTTSAQSKWFVDMVNSWNKSHKQKVRLQYVPVTSYINKRDTAFSGGSGPDIFLLSPEEFLLYYNGGSLYDLSPYMTTAAKQDFYPSVLATRTVGGKIYGLPMEVEPMAFFYSHKAFEAVGLSEADVPKTWDDLLNVAHKLRKGKQFGVAMEVTGGPYQNFTWYPFMWEGHGDAVASNQKTSAFDAPGTIQALALWQDMIKSGVAPRTLLGTGGNDPVSNLASGYAAMQNCGIWGVSALRENKPDFKYGVFKLPVPSGGTYTTVLGGWAFCVNSKGKNPEEAAKFVTWAIGSMSQDSVKRVTDWCIHAKSDISPRKSAAALGEKEGGYSSPQMTYFKNEVFPGGRGEPRYPSQIGQYITQAIQSTQLNGANPKTVAAQTAQQINGYLKTYNGAPIE